MDFIRDLLTTTNSSPNPEDRLSNKVSRVLEFLGFKVTDLDAQIGDDIRKEEFWVQDGDFLAITKVIDAKETRPLYQEYSDLQARMTTVFRHRERVPDSEKRIGLLSTVELYRIAIAVKDGRLSATDGRALIKAIITLPLP